MKGLMKTSYGGSATWRGWRKLGSPRFYIGECAGIRPMGRPRKKWIDTVIECGKEVWMSDKENGPG